MSKRKLIIEERENLMLGNALEMLNYFTEKAEDKLIYILWHIAYTTISCKKDSKRIINHINPLRSMLKHIEWRGYVKTSEIEEIDKLYEHFLKYGFQTWSIEDEFKKGE